jgi:hypothetical protein
VHPDATGYRHARLTATFVPTEPGIARAWPVPFGEAGSTDPEDGFSFQVNSVTERVSLWPAAPGGAEYFVANVTATYVGEGSSDLLAKPSLVLIGRHNDPYRLFQPSCPDDGPAPHLDGFGTLYSGQSATGNLCWTIATNDASTLLMFFAGTSYRTWFALS